jgi:hypothetical protein
MNVYTNTFANQLRHFARSVDIVDDSTFDSVRQLIYRYVRNELGAAYFELMREQSMERYSETGLKMFWSSDEQDHTWPVRGQDGTYTNPVTLAFGEKQPLWIVDRGKHVLKGAGELIDEWSDNKPLGSYEPVADTDVRTLVVLPLRRKRLLGACYFECSEYMRITDVAKKELQILAESISILLELYEINRTQSAMTGNAISDLSERLQSARFPKLTRPHFFYSFSSRAEASVRMVVDEVLKEFDDKLDYTDWSAINESGNINAQIARDIVRARFGICFFSEPSEGKSEGRPAYIDNTNVVFEAGMLHARTIVDDPDSGREPTGWIPMREEDSPPVPFDFAAERILTVPRFRDGALNEGRLREMLRARINTLLDQR